MVSLLRRLFREVLGQGSELAVASSNSAARVIGGETIHSGFGLSGQQAMTIAKLSGQTVKYDFKKRMNRLRAVIVEEVSMVPPALLGAASFRMCKARKEAYKCDVDLYMARGHMFGKVPIVMFLGDFYQLGPVSGKGTRSSLLQRESLEQPVHVRNGQSIFLDGVTHAMFLYETHRFKDRLVTPHKPCPFMPGFLKTMRQGKKLSLIHI